MQIRIWLIDCEGIQVLGRRDALSLFLIAATQIFISIHKVVAPSIGCRILRLCIVLIDQKTDA